MKKTRPFQVLSLLLLFVLSCGPKQGTSDTTAAKLTPVFDPVDVPGTINSDNYERNAVELLSLPGDHPDRIRLRDALIAWSLRAFEQTDVPEQRLKLFQDALNLHVPADFTPGRVNAAMAPMAQWIISHYEKKGKEAWVLASYAYLSLAQPEISTWNEEYLSLIEWTESVRATVEDPIEKYSSIAAVYMDLIIMVPLPAAIEKLSMILARRQMAVVLLLKAMQDQNVQISPMMFHSLVQRGGIGQDIVHAYFLGGMLDRVIPRFKELGVLENISEELIALLEEIEKGQNLSKNHQILATLLGYEDPVSGVRACMMARAADPADPVNALCVGRYLIAMEFEESAAQFFVQAVRADVSDDIAQQAMAGMREALATLHQKEKAPAAARVIQQAQTLVETATDRDDIPEEMLIAAAALTEICGEIAFNDGDIDSASALFQTTIRLWPSMPTPYLKLAEIYNSRSRKAESLDILTGALSSKLTVGGTWRNYWRAMILESRADVYRLMGREKDATDDYQRALETWATADYPMQQEAVIEIRRGVLRDRLGDTATSMEHFQKAIRADPERRASYAEIISYLVIRKRLEDARTFYLIAFNQDRIDAMWKIYYSLWVDGLSRQMDGQPYTLASAYLEASNGSSWQDHLARFFTGRLAADKLRALAMNPGQKVEADFYEAIVHLSKSDRTQARALLQKVIDSDLLGFFEYRMAGELLNGM